MTKNVVKSKSPRLAAETYSSISIDTGLILALVDSDVDSEIARQILTQQVMKGGVDLGIQFPKSKIVRTWHAGGESNKAHIEAANSHYPEPPIGIKRIVRCIEADRRFNWISDAGLMAVAKTIKGNEERNAKDDWQILQQNGVALEDPSTLQALFRLRHEAKSAGNHVMVIIGGINKLNESAEKLFHLCDEVITLEACEADREAHCAIKIALPSLSTNQHFRVGAVMASVIRGLERFNIRFTSFIHAELKHRLAWMMSCRGDSLGEIGEVFSTNKSTVHRWLKSMPLITQQKVDDKLINETLEMLDLEPIQKKKATGSSAQLASRPDLPKKKFAEDSV